MLPLNISAMTLTCAAGAGLSEIRQALADKRSGLRPNDFEYCDLETWIGRVDGIDDRPLDSAFAEFDCRSNRLAALALAQDEFTTYVNACIEHVGANRVACVIGTSTGGISSTEAAYREADGAKRFPEKYLLPRVHTPHTTSAYTSRVLGLDGPVLTVSTACSSSAKVFAVAARMIAAGWADAAVVGGVDSLCLSTLYGFNSLELLASKPCRPFDRDRNGLSLGEAGGFALLERNSDNVLGRLLGWGESSDAHHMASPHPEGAGARKAMTAALESAGLNPSQVGHINCHGTATYLNDLTEAKVINELFPDPPPYSSTKGWTGHTLGAAGITEAVLSLLALNDGLLPACLNCEVPDDIAAAGLLTESRRADVDVVLSNSFGFGGSNCTLALGRA